MVGEVLAVLDDPAHAALFGPGSLAEVPLSAVVDGVVVAGIVDRLLVTDDAVTVVDYKTGRHIPVGAADVRSEEHTSELQSLMRISYAVFCLNKKSII